MKLHGWGTAGSPNCRGAACESAYTILAFCWEVQLDMQDEDYEAWV